MYNNRTNYRQPKQKKKHPILLIAGIVLLGLALAVWFGTRRAEAPDPSQEQPDTNQQITQPAYTPIDLQPVVDAWDAKQPAQYSIVVYDAQSDSVIASKIPDESYFAASLYKIYIAYLTYKDFQSGAQDPDEIISQGRTKRECADAMIRSSDSPCGEAMMADMGQSTLNKRVMEEIGTTGTYFNGIRTTAADSAKVLQLIHEKKDLNDENTAALLDSMLNQDAKFKRGLATGAPEAKWETKVGWNEDDNYHDIGIMTMPDGRKFIVAILSEGQGSSAPLADFAKTIYAALSQQ